MILRGRVANTGEAGQAMPEYALILGLLVLGLIAVFSSLGQTCLRLLQETLNAFAS
jgi:Flp pilus assembly pilin Flp